MWWATFCLSVRNLMLHKLRSSLTLLGTILGVASVIAMLSVGEGSKQEALERIRELGANNVIVRTLEASEQENNGGNSNTQPAMVTNSRYRVNAYGLTFNDLRALSDIPTQESVVPVLAQRRSVSFQGQQLNDARILATTPELRDVRNLQVRRGRFLRSGDSFQTANVAVLSDGAARQLFGFTDPLGKPVLIGSVAFRVVGVLGRADSGIARAGQASGDDANRDIFIPMETGRARFGFLTREGSRGSRVYDRVELSEITLAVAGGPAAEALVEPTATMVRDMLEKSHASTDYQVLVPLELMAQAAHEKKIWNIVLGAIAGISLVVGGIGIMNIMLATVTERTREIGIRRAIGAKRKDIIRQFLVETTVLSATGGLLGVVVGVGIPFLVTLLAGMKTSTSLFSIGLAFGISVLTGIVFGVYPAYKAASMNPIEALREQ